jgi:antirestriction protein
MRGEQQPQATNEPGQPEAPTEPQLNPRIYVASLADYNAGRLHGVWLDAAQEVEDLHLRIGNMLAQSKEARAEEWAIHDFEDFNGLHLGEWEDLGHVSRVAKGIQEHGLAYAHWATMVSEDDELDKFGDSYLGHWPSLTAYAENILEDLGLDETVTQAVPENLRPYVKLDAEGFGRDLQLGGDISIVEEDGGVYVFANR